ncbi:ribosome biogenesis GTPase YqeH [Spiroplasma turonicum]|uniref:GTP-binding protein YqeH n=1 Tax=Spiroplasma turonicum TaxID=216946 RepID=A0A0K1P601_9MOLU|nr:ribosome biogenesis GTPase YqeH [Spiroplasma turonicum]AKU79743.1 GTP-binding protein YqeH [Spiroplasma turonicum]ALX70761.1 GTP-binding protein YqeH [Spiroplasma turonicum]
MKFFNDNNDDNNKIKEIEKEVNDLENKLISTSKTNNEQKIKQTSKVSLKEYEPGIGNTTNFDGNGPKKCVGCGKELQINDEKIPGYVIDIEKQDYCLRCFKIKNYNRLVEQDINDKDFIEILDNINKEKEKIRYYYVVDIFDLPGSRLDWLEKLISTKEVIILANKVDLLPKAVSSKKILDFLTDYFSSSPLKNSKIMLTSSIKDSYIFNLILELRKIKYDQYIIGISNAGKSSLINACLRLNQQIPSIVTSKYVNTTLDKIKINFTKDNFIYDTPGLIKHKHIAIATAPSYWDYFFFQKEIKQITYQLYKDQTIFYGGLAWFSFDDGEILNEKQKPKKTSFHFYVNKRLPLHRTKTLNAMNYFKKHRHSLSPRLKDINYDFVTHNFDFDKVDKVDIHISGLGWINFETFKGMKVSITVPKTEYGVSVKLLKPLI